jgi:FMN reductase
MNIVSISGSPSPRSRSAWLLGLACGRLAGPACSVHEIALRELPPAALVAGDAGDAAVQRAVQAVLQADVVIVATPIYKAAYSGLLKLFLDLLPADALRGKPVLPLATGGSLAHLLALDYALKPVLAALGARHILDSVYVSDAQLQPHEALGYAADDAVLARVDRALQDLPPARSALAAGSARPGPDAAPPGAIRSEALLRLPSLQAGA